MQVHCWFGVKKLLMFHSDAHTLRRCKMWHCATFCADRSNRCGNMAVFQFSRWRPSTILNFLKLEILTALHFAGPKCVIVIILCKWVKALRRYRHFRFLKMAAVRHLGFLKVVNFNCPHPLGGQNASSCQILCRSVEPLQKFHFRFFKMAAIRHLGFVIHLYGPPTKCILVVSVTVQNLV